MFELIVALVHFHSFTVFIFHPRFDVSSRLTNLLGKFNLHSLCSTIKMEMNNASATIVIITDQFMKPTPETPVDPGTDLIAPKRLITTVAQSRLTAIGTILKEFDRILLPVYKSSAPVMYVCGRAEAERKVADFGKETKAYSTIFQFKEYDQQANRLCSEFLFRQLKTVLDELYERKCINGVQYSSFMTFQCDARPDQLEFLPDIYKVNTLLSCREDRFHAIFFLPLETFSPVYHLHPSRFLMGNQEKSFIIISMICSRHSTMKPRSRRPFPVAPMPWWHWNRIKKKNFFVRTRSLPRSRSIVYVPCIHIVQCFSSSNAFFTSTFPLTEFQIYRMKRSWLWCASSLPTNFSSSVTPCIDKTKGVHRTRRYSLYSPISICSTGKWIWSQWLEVETRFLAGTKSHQSICMFFFLSHRCFDQIFITWNGSSSELDRVLNETLRPSAAPFQVSSTCGTTVHYLNVEIRNNQGLLHTKVFQECPFEPYVLSCVPSQAPSPSVPTTLINAALLRAVRCCNHLDDFELEKDRIRSLFIRNHFPSSFIEQCFNSFYREFQWTEPDSRAQPSAYADLRQRIRDNEQCCRALAVKSKRRGQRRTEKLNNSTSSVSSTVDMVHNFKKNLKRRWEGETRKSRKLKRAD